MPLIALWSSNPSAISEFTIEQVLAAAGDGNLRDRSTCSEELRTYLAGVQTTKLAAYVDHCLDRKFAKSGLVLQDLVNELGRRIEYKVTNGRYQGVTGEIGCDGIWVSPEGHSIVVEVKTTDAFRISLDTIVGYRKALLEAHTILAPSSILIVVGRQDTGELEAQVRGSRHAWDIRLISADALFKLVNLKESVEGSETGNKIRTLLVPREFTKLDDMIDVMFTAAKDVESAAESEAYAPDEHSEEPREALETTGGRGFTDSAVLQSKREAVVAAMSKREGVGLIKKSRALHWSADHEVRLACTISKRYTGRGSYQYWYAYHPQWDEFLSEGARGFFVLGCVDLDIAFAIPLQVVRPLLPNLNTSAREDGTRYWHIRLSELPDGSYGLLLPQQGTPVSLADFTVPLE